MGAQSEDIELEASDLEKNCKLEKRDTLLNDLGSPKSSDQEECGAGNKKYHLKRGNTTG